MENYQIQIEETVDESTKNAINDYWLIENGKFVYNQKYFIQKYSLNQSQISKLVKSYSVCVKQEICYTCKETYNRNVDSKSSFSNRYLSNKECINCEEERKRIRLEEQKEYYRRLEEHSLNIENEKTVKFNKAIEERQWLNLNQYEFNIFKKIIESGNLKAIKVNVFKNNFRDYTIWNTVNKLNKLGLIHIVRDLNNNGVLDICFDKSMYQYLSEFVRNSLKSDCLAFSLSKKTNKQSLNTPEYGGTFKLEYDVIIKANEEYLYGGWIQTDGSINLRFTPSKDVKPSAIQTNFENSSWNNQENDMSAFPDMNSF